MQQSQGPPPPYYSSEPTIQQKKRVGIAPKNTLNINIRQSPTISGHASLPIQHHQGMSIPIQHHQVNHYPIQYTPVNHTPLQYSQGNHNPIQSGHVRYSSSPSNPPGYRQGVIPQHKPRKLVQYHGAVVNTPQPIARAYNPTYPNLSRYENYTEERRRLEQKHMNEVLELEAKRVYSFYKR
tara:strand:+ start:1436 stop:1978 length:543 start_codon:yes stop_codon:yes gene_type:complete